SLGCILAGGFAIITWSEPVLADLDWQQLAEQWRLPGLLGPGNVCAGVMYRLEASSLSFCFQSSLTL
ncbi:MAG: hypothetical protein O7D29_07805, partial [Gemmatimonadetes bacterium]|nr:hypothetical protein [Gemmatimonadota bacterium]